MRMIIKDKPEILFVAVPLIFLAIYRILGFDGLYGQDSYEYLRYTLKMKEFLLTGEHPGYFYAPIGYPIIASLFSLIIPNIPALQIVSFLSLIGMVLFLRKIIREIYIHNEFSDIFLLTGLLLSPYIIREGIVVMSDTFACFLLTATTFYCIKYYKSATFRYIFFCVLFGVYSVFTRYAAVVPISIIFIGIAIHWLKIRKLSHLVVILIPFIFILLYIYFKTDDSIFIYHSMLKSWSVANFFKTTFTTAEGTFFYSFPNLVNAFSGFFHPGFYIINGLLIIVLIVKIKTIGIQGRLILLFSIIFYALFIAGIPFQNKRYLNLTYPLILVLIYPAFDLLSQKIHKFRIFLFSLLIVIQIGLSIRAINPFFQRNRLEKEIAEEIKSYQGKTLYSFDMDNSLKGRNLNFNFKNLYLEEYTSFEKGALVLFNEEKLKLQWKDKNPMINWNHLKENYTLIKKLNLPEGWELYQIEN